MGSRIGELVLNSRDPHALAAFWCAVLDFVVLDESADDVEIGPVTGFGGAQPTIIFTRADGRPEPRPWLHIDLNPVGCDQEAELRRLLELGARPADVGQTGEESWHVLADPEGNVFCLLRRQLPPL